MKYCSALFKRAQVISHPPREFCPIFSDSWWLHSLAAFNNLFTACSSSVLNMDRANCVDQIRFVVAGLSIFPTEFLSRTRKLRNLQTCRVPELNEREEADVLHVLNCLVTYSRLLKCRPNILYIATSCKEHSLFSRPVGTRLQSRYILASERCVGNCLEGQEWWSFHCILSTHGAVLLEVFPEMRSRITPEFQNAHVTIARHSALG
jgi:hypothetical protein